MAEFIYTMKKARKAHGEKVILDDVTLMFYPGAKIGVVGPNGAGKSTVLQIMAGLQQPSNGEAYLTPGYTVGILMQEPILNEEKNVIDNVKEGVAETVAMLDRLTQSAMKCHSPMPITTSCSLKWATSKKSLITEMLGNSIHNSSKPWMHFAAHHLMPM